MASPAAPRDGSALATFLVEGARIATFLEEPSALPIACSAFRCLEHFDKYFVMEDSSCAQWTEGHCGSCGRHVCCRVQTHSHFTRCRHSLLEFEGETPCGERTFYTWVPRYRLLLCSSCSVTPNVSMSRVIR